MFVEQIELVTRFIAQFFERRRPQLGSRREAAEHFVVLASAGDAFGCGRVRLRIVDRMVDHRRPSPLPRRFGLQVDESFVDEHSQVVTGGVDVQTGLIGELFESAARVVLHSAQQQDSADLGQPSKIVHSSRHVITSLRLPQWGTVRRPSPPLFYIL